MKTRLFAALTLTLAASVAPVASGQPAGAGGLVAQGAAWKKRDVLRTSANVEQLCFSGDGRLALLASQQGVSVWDWNKERELHYFSFPKGTKLACMAVSPDGKRLATGHLDGTRVLLWDLGKGELLSQFNHGAPVSALTFSADGKQLASGGGHPQEEKVVRDTYVQLWNIADGKPGARFFGLERPVRSIALASDSVVAEDSRGETTIWSRVSGKLSGKIATHAFVTPLALINGGRTLIGYEVGSGRFLTRWDSALEKKEQLIDMSVTSQGGRHGFWCNADGALAATAHPGEIIVWDLKKKERHCTLTIPREPEVLALAFTPDSSEVVVALSNEMVTRLAVERGR